MRSNRRGFIGGLLACGAGMAVTPLARARQLLPAPVEEEPDIIEVTAIKVEPVASTFTVTMPSGPSHHDIYINGICVAGNARHIEKDSGNIPNDVLLKAYMKHEGLDDWTERHTGLLRWDADRPGFEF